MTPHEEWKNKVFSESDVVLITTTSNVFSHTPIDNLGYILTELRRLPSYSHPTLYVRYPLVNHLLSVYGKRYDIEMLSKFIVLNELDHISMVSDSIDLVRSMNKVSDRNLFQLFNLKV